MALSNQEKEKVAEKFEEELIYEALLQFSESDGIVMKMKELYEERKRAIENKPEGICTNLESIKDYLENFVAFVFGKDKIYTEQHPKVIVDGLQKPIGLTVDKFLNALSRGEGWVAE